MLGSTADVTLPRRVLRCTTTKSSRRMALWVRCAARLSNNARPMGSCLPEIACASISGSFEHFLRRPSCLISISPQIEHTLVVTMRERKCSRRHQMNKLLPGRVNFLIFQHPSKREPGFVTVWFLNLKPRLRLLSFLESALC